MQFCKLKIMKKIKKVLTNKTKCYNIIMQKRRSNPLLTLSDRKRLEYFITDKYVMHLCLYNFIIVG